MIISLPCYEGHLSLSQDSLVMQSNAHGTQLGFSPQSIIPYSEVSGVETNSPRGSSGGGQIVIPCKSNGFVLTVHFEEKERARAAGFVTELERRRKNPSLSATSAGYVTQSNFPPINGNAASAAKKSPSPILVIGGSFIALVVILGLIVPKPPSTQSNSLSDVGSLAPPTSPSVSATSRAENAKQVRVQATAQAIEQKRVEAEEKRVAEETARTAQAEKKKRQLALVALDSMRRKNDEVNDVTWYEPVTAPRFVNSRKAIYCYMGQHKEGGYSLRLQMDYVAEDWLFVQNYKFKIDGQNYEITPGTFDVKTDNGSGEIWEWYDIPVGSKEKTILRAIANSDRAILRFEGRDYRSDWTIPNSDKRAIKKMLNTYEALGGTY